MSQDIEVTQPFAALREVREAVAKLSAFDLSPAGHAILVGLIDQLDDAMVFAAREQIKENVEVQKTVAFIRTLRRTTPFDRLLCDVASVGPYQNTLAEIFS